MEHRHGFKMPDKELSAVYHYHFHYIIDSNQAKEKVLTKAVSDSILRKNKTNNQDSDRQSISSHQSWKRLINPQIQINQTHKIRTFKPTSPTANDINLNLDVTNLKMNPPNFEEKKGYMTPKTSTKRQRISTNTTHKNQEQEVMELQENSFGSIGDQYLSKVNLRNLQKSSFAKKNGDFPLQELSQQKCVFEGQSTKISMKQKYNLLQQQKQKEKPSEYAYNLLKEECKYLRRTFLKHYIKNHLLKQDKQKK